jgi:hypothetical protein
MGSGGGGTGVEVAMDSIFKEKMEPGHPGPRAAEYNKGGYICNSPQEARIASFSGRREYTE